MKVGDTVIRKRQRKAKLSKIGGIVIEVKDYTIIINDGHTLKSYIKSDFRLIEPDDITLIGLELHNG